MGLGSQQRAKGESHVKILEYLFVRLASGGGQGWSQSKAHQHTAPQTQQHKTQLRQSGSSPPGTNQETPPKAAITQADSWSGIPTPDSWSEGTTQYPGEPSNSPSQQGCGEPGSRTVEKGPQTHSP